MKTILDYKKLKYHFFLISCIYIFYFIFIPCSIADEAYYDRGQNLKVENFEEQNRLLTLIDEGSMTINDLRYIIHHSTDFFLEDKFGLLDQIQVNQIIVPCLVDLQYSTFTVYTERMPFAPEDKILSKIIIKFKQTK